jgi:hypothetical protein
MPEPAQPISRYFKLVAIVVMMTVVAVVAVSIVVSRAAGIAVVPIRSIISIRIIPISGRIVVIAVPISRITKSDTYAPDSD